MAAQVTDGQTQLQVERALNEERLFWCRRCELDFLATITPDFIFTGVLQSHPSDTAVILCVQS